MLSSPRMLSTQLARSCARHSVLSLDVFDTAIRRLVTHPTDLFHLVESRFRHLTPAASHFDFASARVAAERRARELGRQRCDASDVSLDEIYDVIQFPDDWPRERLRELEIWAERRICRRDETIFALYQQALAAGKTIVFVSDMYLPAEVIGQILDDAGYRARRALLVSGDNKLIKGDGSQFRHLLHILAVAPGDVLHVGDNRASDVAAPAALGITSFHYDARATHEPPAPAITPQDCDASIRHALVEQRLRATSERGAVDDDWFRFGYEFVGCLLLGFADWVRRSLLADGVDRALFLARDGHVLIAAYERLLAAGRPGPPAAYLYASRRALNIPAIDRVDEDCLDFLVASRPGLTVAQYLERAGLDAQRHAPAIADSGLRRASFVPRTKLDFTALRRLFRALEAPLVEHADAERRLLVDYVRQLGMLDGGKVAVVDIGWQGSMQRALHRVFALEHLDVQLVGYYLGTTELARRLTDRGHVLRGFVFEGGRPAQLRNLCMTGAEILEFILLAPHGSVIGYARHGDRIEPVLGPNDADAAKLAAAARVQAGALQFVDDVVAVWRDFPLMTMTAECAFAPIARVIEEPTAKEAERLGDLLHADGYGPAFIAFPIARPPAWHEIMRDPGRLYREYERAFWKPGFLARLDTPEPLREPALALSRVVAEIERPDFGRWYWWTRDTAYNVAQRYWPGGIRLAKQLLGRH